MGEAAEKARSILKGTVPPGLESLAEAYRELRAVFPEKSDSWFYRALYRALAGVEPAGRGRWLVKGFRELGDARPLYNVWVSEGRYMCDCFFRPHGQARMKSICTHIAAVMLWRRQRKLDEFRSDQ